MGINPMHIRNTRSRSTSCNMIRDNEFRFAFVEKTPVFQGIDGQRRIGNSFGIPIAFTTFN
jgi:hypothetical protein